LKKPQVLRSGAWGMGHRAWSMEHGAEGGERGRNA